MPAVVEQSSSEGALERASRVRSVVEVHFHFGETLLAKLGERLDETLAVLLSGAEPLSNSPNTGMADPIALIGAFVPDVYFMSSVTQSVKVRGSDNEALRTGAFSMVAIGP